MTHSQPALTLVVWSDHVCPFCHLDILELDAQGAQSRDHLIQTVARFI